ncbi:carboxypeptidase regulatory-like domain-containing protein [Rhizomonospora bruguierae]|uniref:carboxypeptidase regulatory-like domain-containing protein n=1 Tax=Rhizomonospora bruguierae TaxID=1581705 RepID=UPI001BCD189E|nr:carboxypeptidase regulatory-like domain-containing protein [Micromonospora sp. NBRC 107566]
MALPRAALAVNPDVNIDSLTNASLRSGEQATMKYSIVNRNTEGPPANFTIQVRVFDGLSCSGDCSPSQRIEPGDRAEFTVTLKAGNVAQGQTKRGQVQVTASAPGGILGGTDQGSDSRNMTVQGPDAPSTVAEISGKVADLATGDGIGGALVGILDSDNHAYTTNTNESGSFKFTGSAGKPITPGEIQITAQKSGWSTPTKSINVQAGQASRNVRVVMRADAAPSATPTAEATVEVPTDEPTEEEAAEETGVAQAPAANNQDSGGGFLSLLLIILGGLLVALGIGAIVLLMVRRRREDGDPDEPVPTAGAPVPNSRGGYRGGDDATRVARPDPTMAARNAALADAPTTMLRPAVDDEFPDPYGAPPMRPGQGAPDYGAPTQVGGWSDEPDPGYRGGAGATGYGGAGAGAYGAGPASGAGAYGNNPASGGGAYGGGPATGAGAYPNNPASGAGAYGGGQYGAPRAGDGYGGRGDYPSAGAGGYDTRAGGTEQYDEPTGRYDRGGPGPGYGQPAGGDGGGYGGSEGYGAGQGGYDQRGGYGGAEPGYGHGAVPEGGGYQEQGYDQRGGYAEGYDAQGGGYGGVAGGGGGYQEPGAGGYGAAGGGYQAPTASGSGGGYDQGGYDRGGYDRGGYDRGGYEQGGGGYGQAADDYDRVPPQRGGYEDPHAGGGYAPRGGADQGGYYEDDQQNTRSSRHAAPPPPAPPGGGGGGRRTVDWLDD